ncbi:FadR/GntR family transcriptional regulator [Alkaliphilus serpentinus]|uniref:FadR family transcriptional regulator n=1 Tax=Alkaliphilus serpentinus TaxID=1482731 RepID=A0A833HLT1_9FIRM|nr:FadR/GntR family transcriptional regulator [Alkaliphilus serpentinus]KAB3526349.1 FadR family transcriptional regulator [Alkaliphilus serpentinus]
MFKPIKTKRVYQQIVDQINQLMRQGELKPGDKLMSEKELADKLKVSRTSVREALSALDFLGVLESKQGDGTFISEVSQQSLIEPLALFMMLDREASIELLEVRKIMEAQAAELAAMRSDDDDLSKISKAIELMEVDLEKKILGEENDAMFHYAIAEATKNKTLVKLMNMISDLVVQNMRTSRQYLYSKKGNPEKLFQQHYDIYVAIKDGNPSLAKKAMFNHLDFVERELTNHQD